MSDPTNVARVGRDPTAYADRTLLVSIHTRYAELILAGTKRVELRRRFDADAAGSRMLIYATLPTAAVIGHARIDQVHRLPIEDIWKRHGDRASISSDDFDRYFEGVRDGCAVLLSDPKRFASPVPLESMRAHGLAPPQSYVFLREEHHRALIEHERN